MNLNSPSKLVCLMLSICGNSALLAATLKYPAKPLTANPTSATQPADKGAWVNPTDRFQKTTCGTVVDKLTGLEWYANAGTAKTSVSAAETYVNGLTLASNCIQGGWMVPSINELNSLNDYSVASGILANSTLLKPFSNVKPARYWTRTKNKTPSAGAHPNWYVFFDQSGHTGTDCHVPLSDSSIYVWPVRSANVKPGGWVKTECGFIDTNTGLEWYKDANLSGKPDWGAAKTSAANLSCGSKVWHLPTIDEYNGLINKWTTAPDKKALTLANWLTSQGFSNVRIDDWYWSSTPHSSSSAWTVVLLNGDVSGHFVGYSGYVWPVR